PRTAGKISSKGMTSKQGRSHKTATGASAREVCAAAEPQETPGLSDSAPNEQQSCSGGDSVGKNSTAAGKHLLDAGKKSCGFLAESSKKVDTAGAWGRSTSPGTGTLQEKGHCRTILSFLLMALTHCSRAWERCRQCQTSADAAAARTRFMERIQMTVSFPSRHRVQLFCSELPAGESYASKNSSSSWVSRQLCPDCTGDVGSCSPACFPARGQTCDTADVLAVPLLYYSSLQELRDLFALKLQVSMLHQEIALQKVMMAELLPVLEAGPFLEGSAGLLRAVHTQLCQGGRRFPVLVRDELLD
ncbi:TEDC2 protein, partial [Leiothrix lutea]|nr:TEDC2 protein [Leiothrix lutea]